MGGSAEKSGQVEKNVNKAARSKNMGVRIGRQVDNAGSISSHSERGPPDQSATLYQNNTQAYFI